MQKYLRQIVFIGIWSTSAMQMPCKTVLQERLQAIGMHHFHQRTTLVAQLAGQTIKDRATIIAAVEAAESQYKTSIDKEFSADEQKQVIPVLMTAFAHAKPLVIEALLKQ